MDDEEDHCNFVVDTLEDAGCLVCLYGKVDVGAGVIEAPGQENATVPGFHGGPTLSITGRSADIRRPTKPDPINITNDSNNHVHEEDWLKTKECMEWFDEKHSSSWMLYCSVNIPHPAFATNATWLESVHEDLINIPTWIPKDKFHPADSYMSQSKDVWREFTDAEILAVRKTYYAMCVETDYLLGRVIDKANATGHLENTFVIYVSDHGEMNMEHRQVWKNSMYEASARVPMIIAGPGVPAGRRVSNLTSLLDLYPTMVDIVGGEKPDWLDGHSLAPFLSSASSPAGSNFAKHFAVRNGVGTYPFDRAVIAQYHSNMGNTGSFMVRWGPWKYIAYGRTLKRFADYTPQLFHVASDPEELTDFADTAQGKIIAKMLDTKLRAVVDYPKVDKMVIKNDAEIYQRWFLDKIGESATRAHWEQTYRGFDDDDWKKVTAWYKEVSTL